ncbi:hypothetical protein WJX79_007485 [Trebouxia sp. C0005]
MRKHASGNSNQVSASPATSCTVINSHLPNWARTTNGDAAQDRPPAQDVTNRLLPGSSKWQTNKLQVFPEQSTGTVPTLHQGLAQQRHTPSFRHPSSTPAFSTASGPLSAVPTGFSSDARRVVDGLAGPEPGTVGGSSQHRHRQQTFTRPGSNAQGTGWSALYDESSEEEDQSGLQAEDSQASSLSFQPHNLFKEHFAVGSSAATSAAALNTSLSPPAHGSNSTILSQDAAASRDTQRSLGRPRSAAAEAQANTPVEHAHQAGSKGKSRSREGLKVAQGTPCTPAARRSGRSGAGRGLATQLEGMQAQLDDLDAMWNAVNAHKSQAASRHGVQVDVDRSGNVPSDSFPGFALLAAKTGAVAAGDLRASDRHDSVSGGNADSLLFLPVPSQEAVLRPPTYTSSGNAQLVHNKKRASAQPAAAVGVTLKTSTAASKAVKGSRDRLPQHSQQSGSIAALQPRHSAVSPFGAKSPHGQLQALEHMLQSLPQRHPKGPAATSRAPTPAPTSIQPSFRLSFSPTGIPSVNPAPSPELRIQTQQKTEGTAHGVAESKHKAASVEDCTAADERDFVNAGDDCAWPETRSLVGAE